MADSRRSHLTRRTFLKGAGVATAAAVSPTIIVRGAKSDTLKIGQWTHFVPAFDEWFERDGAALDVTQIDKALPESAGASVRLGVDARPTITPPGRPRP
ncbi:MAG: hypothetical protein DMD87_07580 [Candidatus Rokuibacteriota bacterium]|nr:MAG: hypothetical protein DMD87_07580 [Candidatus Rokubacteria bacterium]